MMLFSGMERFTANTEEGSSTGDGGGRQLLRSDCSSHQVLKYQRSSCSNFEGFCPVASRFLPLRLVIF